MSPKDQTDPAELLLRYRIALRAGRMGVWEWDIASGAATWIDDAGVLPARSGEPEGTFESFIARLHPDDAPAVVAAIREAMSEGKAFHLHFRTGAGEDVRWVQAAGEVQRSEDGTPQRLIGVAADVTDAELAKEELQTANELLEHIVASSDLILFSGLIIDEGHITTYVSRNVEQHLGYTPEDLMQPNAWFRLVHPDDEQELVSALEHPKPGTAIELEMRYRHADGTYRWIRTTTRFEETTGGPTRTLGYAVDVTEQHRAEERMRQAQRMEVVGELAGGIAHDFNNLLTAVIGYADMAAAAVPEDSPAGHAVAESRAAADRASRLVAQLLTFGRRQETRAERVRVDDVVRGLRTLLDVTTGDDVAVHVETSDDAPAVEIDPGQLEQVLVNLVVNARDALPSGGEVVVRTGAVDLEGASADSFAVPQGRYARLSVSDTGTGIPASALPHVFEPFFTTKETGSGLGLAMVYGIVTQAGGTCSISSAPQEGSTVEILLPAAAGTVRDGETDQDEPSASNPRGSGRVLLVEDHPQVRTLATAALMEAGHEVLVAADGAQALALAHRAPSLDLLVTDVVMPGLSGPELADRLRDRRPGLRVLFVSGFPNAALGTEAGMAFLAKPYTLSELTEGVAALLRSAR